MEFAHTREQVAGLKAQIKASDKELEDRKAEQQRILKEYGIQKPVDHDGVMRRIVVSQQRPRCLAAR